MADTIRYDTRCYFNVRSKANVRKLNLPHGCELLFVTELNNKRFYQTYILKDFFEWLSLTWHFASITS